MGAVDQDRGCGRRANTPALEDHKIQTGDRDAMVKITDKMFDQRDGGAGHGGSHLVVKLRMGDEGNG